MVKIPDTRTIRVYKHKLKLITVLHLLIYLSYLILVANFTWALLHNPISIYGLFGVLFIGLIDIWLYRRVQIEKKENDRIEKWVKDTWGNGAITEMMVQEDLESLPENYKILSDFCKKIDEKISNIDFIIICEKGIFSIEVKANAGLISCHNHQLYSYHHQLRSDGGIYQTRGNATYLSDLLEKRFNKRYFVQGILEYPRGTINTISIHGIIDHIWIGGARFHEYVIKKSKYNISNEEVDLIFSYLELVSSEVKLSSKKFQ